MSKRDFSWLVALVVLGVYLFFVHARAYSANDASRMAAIESMVHRGTWAIDDSPFQTIDRIKVGDHFYSDKPPVLALLGAAIYAPLHHGFGLTLQATGCNPETDPAGCRALLAAAEADWAYVAITFFLVMLPGAAMAVLAYRLGRRSGLGNGLSLLLAFLLAFGTAVFPFSTVFTNHVPTAAALFTAVYLLLSQYQPTRNQLLLVGFLAGLAVTLDLSAGLFLVGLLGYIFWRWRGQVRWVVLGGLLPALVMLVLDYQIVGNPFPPQLYAPGYAYEGSALYANVSGFSRSDNVLRYTFDLLFGDHGVFAFFPLVFWFVAALGAARQLPLGENRVLAWIVGGSTAVYLLYFILSTDNFGGIAYSPRWLLLPVPLLAIFALINPRLYASRWRVGLLLLLSGLSVWSGWRGAQNPWREAYPLLRLAVAEPAPQRRIAAAVSGYPDFAAAEQAMVTAGLSDGFGRNDLVLRRWFDARFGLVVPATDAWWFVAESTPLAPVFAARLKLPAGADGFILQANLHNAADEWVGQMAHAAWQDGQLVPVGDEGETAVPLPATFIRDDDAIALLGYEINLQDTHLELVTAWEVQSRSFPTGERKLFVHLLNRGGEIVAQSDGWYSTYESLLPGDRYFQVQTVDVGTIPQGEYWLQIGLYEPQTGQRLAVSGQDRLLLRQLVLPPTE